MNLPKEILEALEDYNNSPWRTFGVDITKEYLEKILLENSIEYVLRYIKNRDLYAYRKEEYYGGML